MDIWQLGIFCKVVERGGFSKASKVVNLTQPTVSSHVRELERHFGCKLIDRLARRAVPTQAGELLYAYARKLILLRDEMETAMAEFQGKIRGCLKIGGSTIPGGYILPGLIGGFKQQYPGVSIALNVSDTNQIIRKIGSAEIEFGIVGAKTAKAGIVQKKLIKDQMKVIVPSDHKWKKRKTVNLDVLLKEPFIIREEGSGTLKSIALGFAQKGSRLEDLNVVAEMGSTEAVIQAIKGRLGISVLSPIAVAEELQIGTLKALSIKTMDLTRYFYLTLHQHRSQSPLGKAFIAYLSQALAADPSAA